MELVKGFLVDSHYIIIIQLKIMLINLESIIIQVVLPIYNFMEFQVKSHFVIIESIINLINLELM